MMLKHISGTRAEKLRALEEKVNTSMMLMDISGTRLEKWIDLKETVTT